MTTEQKLIFWANAYNAALTGFLSVRTTHYDFNAVPIGERDKIRQNCQNFQHASLPIEQLKDVPQPVALLLQMLLQKDPSRRFKGPAELLKAIWNL